MKKNTIVALAILIFVGLGIGGKMYMDREKDKQELLTIQKDLANYLYTNYRLYTKNEKITKKIKEAYNEGSLTNEEYLKQMKETREYLAIEKVQFTRFSITPMNTVKAYFTINGVYKDDVLLDTISAETDKLMYTIGVHSGEGPYYIEEKKEKTDKIIPDETIVYYDGVIK